MTKSDSREDILHEDTHLASAFIKTLFGVLYEVYSSAVSDLINARKWNEHCWLNEPLHFGRLKCCRLR